MPLRVICPQGCRFQLPRQKAGQTVRCPRCKSMIRIPVLAPADEGGTAASKMIIVSAEKVEVAPPQALPDTSPVEPQSAANAEGTSPPNVQPEKRQATPLNAAPPNAAPPNVTPLPTSSAAVESAEPTDPGIVDPPSSADLERQPTTEPSGGSSTLETRAKTPGPDESQPERLPPKVAAESTSSSESDVSPQPELLTPPPAIEVANEVQTAADIEPAVEPTDFGQDPQPDESVKVPEQDRANEPAAGGNVEPVESPVASSPADGWQPEAGTRLGVEPKTTIPKAADLAENLDSTEHGGRPESAAVERASDIGEKPATTIDGVARESQGSDERDSTEELRAAAAQDERSAEFHEIQDSQELSEAKTLSEDEELVFPVLDLDNARPVPTAEDLELPQIVLDEDRLEAFQVRQNVRVFEASRRSVARLIAFLIALIGLANIAIALWQSGWLTDPAASRLQMWATVTIMVGALHLAYAFFLSQVGDWSANWVAAAFLLAIAAGYACSSVVLGLAGMENVFVRWLELPVMLKAKGSIWSMCMVLVSASLAWWCGREALHWRQMVDWLRSFSS